MAAKTQSLPGLGTRRGKPGLFARILGADALWRQRRRLEELDGHLLDDIGLTRHDVRKAHGPRWDAPDHWFG